MLLDVVALESDDTWCLRRRYSKRSSLKTQCHSRLEMNHVGISAGEFVYLLTLVFGQVIVCLGYHHLISTLKFQVSFFNNLPASHERLKEFVQSVYYKRKSV